MQTIDSLLMQDLSHFHLTAISNPIIAQIASDPDKKEPPKRSLASVQAKKRKYYWTAFQQRRYVKFLIQNNQLCSLSLNERKAKKVNHLMSKRVKTRNPAQCHTHHQKMLEKYKDIPTVIENHRHLLDCPSGTKSDTNIIQSSYEAKQANQIREWKSVDQILMNIGLYEGGEANGGRFDRGMDICDQEVDLFRDGWVGQREWIDW